MTASGNRSNKSDFMAQMPASRPAAALMFPANQAGFEDASHDAVRDSPDGQLATTFFAHSSVSNEDRDFLLLERLAILNTVPIAGVHGRPGRDCRAMPGKLSVIIPVYNERGTLEEVLSRVGQAPMEKEVIVVDDGSDDGTREILERLSNNAGRADRLRIVFHERNRGKGAAVRTGIAQATGDWILIQDADLEYDPRDYPMLLAPLQDGRADVVYGSRFLHGAHRTRYLQHYLANRFLTFVSNLMTNQKLSDMETGDKVFRREVLDGIRLRSNRFEIEPEITVKLTRQGYRIHEIPISYNSRSYQEGKKITWVDGLKALWALFRYRFFS